MLAGGLAKVDLDEQEGEVKHDAERDDGDDGVTVDAGGDEAKVREEESKLKAENACDVAVKRMLALFARFPTLAPERRKVAEY